MAPFEPRLPLALGVVILLVTGLRVSLLDFTSGDYLRFLSPWYDFIVSYGGFSALKYGFSEYSPLYLYLLTLATLGCFDGDHPAYCCGGPDQKPLSELVSTDEGNEEAN